MYQTIQIISSNLSIDNESDSSNHSNLPVDNVSSINLTVNYSDVMEIVDIRAGSLSDSQFRRRFLNEIHQFPTDMTCQMIF